jgi:hypothetical protein
MQELPDVQLKVVEVVHVTVVPLIEASACWPGLSQQFASI